MVKKWQTCQGDAYDNVLEKQEVTVEDGWEVLLSTGEKIDFEYESWCIAKGYHPAKVII